METSNNNQGQSQNQGGRNDQSMNNGNNQNDQTQRMSGRGSEGGQQWENENQMGSRSSEQDMGSGSQRGNDMGSESRSMRGMGTEESEEDFNMDLSNRDRNSGSERLDAGNRGMDDLEDESGRGSSAPGRDL